MPSVFAFCPSPVALGLDTIIRIFFEIVINALDISKKKRLMSGDNLSVCDAWKGTNINSLSTRKPSGTRQVCSNLAQILGLMRNDFSKKVGKIFFYSLQVRATPCIQQEKPDENTNSEDHAFSIIISLKALN